MASTFPISINEDDVKLFYYGNNRKSCFGEECQLKKVCLNMLVIDKKCIFCNLSLALC